MLEMSDATYRKYENDKNSPDFALLSKIAKFYDKSIFDFLPEEYKIFNHPVGGDNSSVNGFQITNNFSDKLIEQYEHRIKEKEEIIKEKSEEIKQLRAKLGL